MESIEYTLMLLIFLGLIFFLLIRLLYSAKEKKKRSTDSLFGMEEIKEKKAKSPNFIVQLLYNFSKAFFKILPFLGSIATKRNEEANKKLDDKLEKAGRPFDFHPDEFNKLKLFTSVTFFTLLFIVAIGNNNTNFYVYAIAFGIIGYVYPDFFITGLLQKRAKQVSTELPDAMDFISLCLAAGMNFQLALEEYVKRNKTILADEFDVFINDVHVGIHRVDAFQHLLDRNEAPEFRRFLSSIIQGERLGTPLRPVIMNQAEELRAKRSATIEKEIATAPTKMLFPLIMFILPAMLMIILGSVLLPTQEKKETDMQLTMKNFIYYQVTPGVKAYVNGQETTIYAIRVVQDPLTGETQLQFTKGAIETPEQEAYIRSLFKSKGMEQAWFIRLVLPEGELAKYYISIEAQNGQRASDYIALKYVKINLPEFDEQGNMYTSDKSTSVSGSITPGLNLKVKSRNQDLPCDLNKQTGEFKVEGITLKGKTNAIQFVLSDDFGLTKTISK